jgi:molecular chaperone GrpE (heat shock protein)
MNLPTPPSVIENGCSPDKVCVKQSSVNECAICFAESEELQAKITELEASGKVDKKEIKRLREAMEELEKNHQDNIEEYKKEVKDLRKIIDKTRQKYLGFVCFGSFCFVKVKY